MNTWRVNIYQHGNLIENSYKGKSQAFAISAINNAYNNLRSQYPPHDITEPQYSDDGTTYSFRVGVRLIEATQENL